MKKKVIIIFGFALKFHDYWISFKIVSSLQFFKTSAAIFSLESQYTSCKNLSKNQRYFSNIEHIDFITHGG